MEEDDVFDFKEENCHTFNIGSNSFGIGSHTSKFLPPFLKVPMESSKRASQSTKFTTNIQGKCPSITGLVGKLKKGGRPGAKFKIPKVQLPLQEVAVEEKDETTSRKEISLDIGRLSIAPKEEVKRKEELEESHEEMSDSQAVTEVLEEFVPVSESAHIEEDLREKIEEEPQRDPTYPFF